MHSSRFLSALALQAACFATATPIAPRALNFDEVAVLGVDGRMVIMNEAEYSQLEASYHTTLEAAPQVVKRQLESRPASPKLHGRCEESTETQVTSDTTFVNWDVAMSPVVGAQGGATTVGVTEGYSVANELSIQLGGTMKMIAKAILKSAQAYKEINSDTTWTSTQTSTLTFQIPEGQYGLVVSQPLVRRIQGNILSGCTDAWANETFTLDSYTPVSYGALSWVQGVIRICNSTAYPVPYCIGAGFHE